ncbi:SAG-related sequence [Besnoitia besnoiti]|uniref:SAG-related sequence n=1 Tax=Besnoitia besnoiti TaxID=94643 RepID=A0A2A9MKE6_BESBE|nr:SAG-related sequence [Besnoitia besnoiti]PFH36087.1 SAG-related sequence [Besnoitia besnoiti]
MYAKPPAFVRSPRGARLRYCSSYQVGLMVLLSSMGLIALSVHTTFSHVRALASETKLVPECILSGKVTTCTCDVTKTVAEGKAQAAILSQTNNGIKLECKSGLECAPKGLSQTVCTAEDESLSACSVALHTLLADNQKNVTWTDCAQREIPAASTCKTLSVPQDNFPFIDERFAVGCADGNNSNQKICKVAVTVTARPSVTEGQTVRCAYGANSNQSRQSVTLSPSKNNFTLVCGEKGEVLPKKYDQAYCPAELKGDQEACDGNYKSILPGYEEQWWEKRDEGKSYTLSIPADKFPKEQSKIVVGCQQKTQQTESKVTGEGVSGPTLCAVDVTIEAGASPSLSAVSSRISLMLLGSGIAAAATQGI